MFEDKTYENLMKEKLAQVKSTIDKREGSLLHFACGANSAEAAQMYITLEWMFRQMFGDTAEREYLAKIAYDTRGLIPEAATHAVLKGKFNIEVKSGIRFSLDDLNYYVSDFIEQKDGFFYYQMICETLGEAGNRNFGDMIPIDYVLGLTTCELTEVLIPGEDEEDTEVFRQRWRDSFNAAAFGGNRADYREKIKAIDGVGGVKCYRATNAAGEKVGGHVRCVVIASDYSEPSTVLIDNIQTIIDPEQNHAEGDGLAPIGHIVTIAGAAGVKINVVTTITFDTGYTFADIKSRIETAVETYLLSLRRDWEKSVAGLVVRIKQIEAALLDVEGILDVADTKLNGKAENIQLGVDEIPLRGEISG